MIKIYSKQSYLTQLKIMKVSVDVLFFNWCLLGVKKGQATPTKYPLGILLKISVDHPRSLNVRVPQGFPPYNKSITDFTLVNKNSSEMFPNS